MQKGHTHALVETLYIREIKRMAKKGEEGAEAEDEKKESDEGRSQGRQRVGFEEEMRSKREQLCMHGHIRSVCFRLAEISGKRTFPRDKRPLGRFSRRLGRKRR